MRGVYFVIFSAWVLFTGCGQQLTGLASGNSGSGGGISLDVLFNTYVSDFPDSAVELPGNTQRSPAPHPIQVSVPKRPIDSNDLVNHVLNQIAANAPGGPRWASTNPLDQVNTDYPPVLAWERFTGYVFRCDTRSLEQVQAAGGFWSPAYYQGSLDKALNILARGRTHRWLRRWAQQLQFAPTKSKPNGTPTLEANAVRVRFQRGLFAPGTFTHESTFGDFLNFLSHVQGWQPLSETFFSYTRLNPLLHSVSPMGKEWVSNTLSPVVAKGFSRDMGAIRSNVDPAPEYDLAYDDWSALVYDPGKNFLNTAKPYDTTFKVYVVYVQDALVLPQRTTDPWDSTKHHLYRHFEQHEVLVPTVIPFDDVVAVAGLTNQGTFQEQFQIRAGLETDDPERFRLIYNALSGYTDINAKQ